MEKFLVHWNHSNIHFHQLLLKDRNSIRLLDYQTITLETVDVEEEIDEPEQIDWEIDKNLDIPNVIDDESGAKYH